MNEVLRQEYVITVHSCYNKITKYAIKLYINNGPYELLSSILTRRLLLVIFHISIYWYSTHITGMVLDNVCDLYSTDTSKQLSYLIALKFQISSQKPHVWWNWYMVDMFLIWAWVVGWLWWTSYHKSHITRVLSTVARHLQIGQLTVWTFTPTIKSGNHDIVK